MYEVYFQHFTKKVSLEDDEKALIQSYLQPKEIRKKEFLLQLGEVCDSIAFVEKGLLKAYTIDENNGEHIIQFAAEGWYISDLYSFHTQEPATYTINAIENSHILLLQKQAHEELLQICPKYERFTRILMTNAYIALQKRINANVSDSVDERYEDFMRKYPHIAQRVPLHMIASFLGLTPETLSRIRRRISDLH